MAWARLDDGFHDHPKVDGLTLAAVGLYTLCLTWAHRHRKGAILPGHITSARVNKLAGKDADRLSTELMAAGLWESEHGLGGWLIHDFADYLPKERDPDERREAGRKGAAAKWQKDGKPDGKQPGKADGNLPAAGMASDGSRASAPAFPSRPVPNVVSPVEGDRPETLRAVPATEPSEDGEHCTRHPSGNPLAEPCRGCQAVEERKQRRADRETDKRQREAKARELGCDRCDGANEVDPETKLPTKRKCDHTRRAS